MSGVDRAKARAEKEHKAAQVLAEKHLRIAAKALQDLYYTAKELGYPGVRGMDDTRVTLRESCLEYANYLAIRLETK